MLGLRKPDNLFPRASKPKTSRLNIWQNTWPTFFISFTSVFYLSVLTKPKHTAHMCGGVKTLKHNLRNNLRLAYNGSKNLTHTSKTRQVKRTQIVATATGSRFASLLLCQTTKTREQPGPTSLSGNELCTGTTVRGRVHREGYECRFWHTCHRYAITGIDQANINS